MIASRRSFLRGLFVAPAIVSVTNIMPVKAIEWLIQEQQLRAAGNNTVFDAGMFYCPYVPLQVVGATNAIGANGVHIAYDPVYISQIRRQMPNLIAYDIAGVQPMSEEAGQIFNPTKQFKTRYGIIEWPILNANSLPYAASERLILSKEPTK